MKRKRDKALLFSLVKTNLCFVDAASPMRSEQHCDACDPSHMDTFYEDNRGISDDGHGWKRSRQFSHDGQELGGRTRERKF